MRYLANWLTVLRSSVSLFLLRYSLRSIFTNWLVAASRSPSPSPQSHLCFLHRFLLLLKLSARSHSFIHYPDRVEADSTFTTTNEVLELETELGADQTKCLFAWLAVIVEVFYSLLMYC